MSCTVGTSLRSGRAQLGPLSRSSGCASPSTPYMAGSTSGGAAALTMAQRACFSTSPCVNAKPRKQRSGQDPMALDKMGKFNFDDIPTLGHLALQRHRELLHYARIAEWEMPKLKELRKPYVPPSPDAILRLRSVHYQGEAHPVTRKSVLTVKIADLFNSGRISSRAARRKLLLLAGPRWNPFEKRIESSESDAAEGQQSTTEKELLDLYGEQEEIERIALDTGVGSIKISCELFPNERMNIKWCSDAVDKLIEEANTDAEAVKDVPIDLRHAKAREESRKGFKRHGAPSLKDFPAEWLSKPSPSSTSSGR